MRQARGGNGIDAISDEIDELLTSAASATTQAVESFFRSFDENPDPHFLARWLEPRCWKEIDYVFLLNEEIRRYGMGFSRKHITLLAKQSFQEAEHYEDIGKAIESLGGTVPTSVPSEVKVWSEWLWECLDRHPLAAVAAWNLSETCGEATLAPTFRAGERHGLDEVVRVYKKVELDERFHVNLGRQLMSTYAETDDDRREILRAMQGMHDIAWQAFTPESVSSTAR